MEHYAKSQLAKAVVQEAVDQCNEIENSLEGCLKVLQKIRMPHLTSEDDQTRFRESQRELCVKRSYTVCLGKKSPDLIEINDVDALSGKSQVERLIKYAGRKLKSILRTQESILQRLDVVNEKIWKKSSN